MGIIHQIEFPKHICEFDVTGVCVHCGKGKSDEQL